MAPADDDAGSIRHDDVGPAIGMMDHADGFRHGLLWAWRAASYHARITFLSNLGRLFPCARVGDVEMLHMAWASLPQAGAQLLLPSCAAMSANRPDAWAIILAGGDGLRLRSLTQKIAGDLRPKQFCALVDGETMFDRTRRRAGLLVRPDRQVAVVTPETDYGWVEPSRLPLPVDGPPVFPVRRFWEKPSPTLARLLLERRCLWNSFVMVGWTSAFIDCVRATVPEALVTFVPLRQALGTPQEEAVAAVVYAHLAPLSFSARVPVSVPDRLLAVTVKDVGWSDWGHTAWVMAALRRTGRQPTWLEPDGLASTA